MKFSTALRARLNENSRSATSWGVQQSNQMESFLHILRNRRSERAPPRALGHFAGAIAPDDERPPTLAARLAAFPLLFIPWLILYESVVNLGPPSGAFQTYLPGELHWPIWQWTEVLYVSPYVLVSLAPFVITTNGLLRRFTVAGMLATVIGHLILLVVPAIAPPRPFEPHDVLGAMMLLDRRLDLNNGSAAFPSFHAFWVFLGASAFAARWPRWRYLAWAWATGVSTSCVFTGMDGAVDVVGGFALYLLAWFHQPILLALKRQASRPGVFTSQPFVEITWNVVTVAVMLHLSRVTVAPEIVLCLYLIFWALSRFAYGSLQQAMLVPARVSPDRPALVRSRVSTAA
jgi:membrane-associated phospholipid phosphatase